MQSDGMPEEQRLPETMPSPARGLMLIQNHVVWLTSEVRRRAEMTRRTMNVNRAVRSLAAHPSTRDDPAWEGVKHIVDLITTRLMFSAMRQHSMDVLAEVAYAIDGLLAHDRWNHPPTTDALRACKDLLDDAALAWQEERPRHYPMRAGLDVWQTMTLYRLKLRDGQGRFSQGSTHRMPPEDDDLDRHR